MLNRIECIKELSKFIETKSWYHEIEDPKSFGPFRFENETITFDRTYGQDKYLELERKYISEYFIGKINDDQTRKEIEKSLNSYNKQLDRYLIDVIDIKLKKYNIDKIIFENVFSSIEYVRDEKDKNKWLELLRYYDKPNNLIKTPIILGIKQIKL